MIGVIEYNALNERARALHDGLFELSRFETWEAGKTILQLANEVGASDVILHTGRPIVFNVEGRYVSPLIERRLENDEMDRLTNALFDDPEASTRIHTGKGRPGAVTVEGRDSTGRRERLRFRLQGVAVIHRASRGIELTARGIPHEPIAWAELGIENGIDETFFPNRGIVLVTGVTGSGKSTLLASGLAERAARLGDRVVTLEDPIEFVQDSWNITQSEVGTMVPDFATGLQEALRRGPDGILVGEVRSPEELGMLVAAANTGHATYSTLHASSPAKAIYRITNEFEPSERRSRIMDLVESLRLVISQDLLPTKDGRRVAVRSYMTFPESLRLELMGMEPETIAEVIESRIEEYGQSWRQAIEPVRDRLTDDVLARYAREV